MLRIHRLNSSLWPKLPCPLFRLISCLRWHLLTLSQPNRSRQMAAHLEPGSVRGFFPLKGSFSLPLSPSACSWGNCWVSVNYRVWSWPALHGKCHEITSVVIWRYINKIDLTWLDFFATVYLLNVLQGMIQSWSLINILYNSVYTVITLTIIMCIVIFMERAPL